jgi:hypothetical protein
MLSVCGAAAPSVKAALALLCSCIPATYFQEVRNPAGLLVGRACSETRYRPGDTQRAAGRRLLVANACAQSCRACPADTLWATSAAINRDGYRQTTWFSRENNGERPGGGRHVVTTKSRGDGRRPGLAHLQGHGGPKLVRRNFKRLGAAGEVDLIMRAYRWSCGSAPAQRPSRGGAGGSITAISSGARKRTKTPTTFTVWRIKHPT